MNQRTYQISGYTEEKAREILLEVSGLAEYQHAGRVLLLVLEQSWARERIEEKIRLIQRILPKAEIVGVTHNDSVADNKAEETRLSFLFFGQAAFDIRRISLTGKSDWEIGKELGRGLCDLPNLRGVMTLFAKRQRDIGEIVETAAKGLGEIPFFGAYAAAESPFAGG